MLLLLIPLTVLLAPPAPAAERLEPAFAPRVSPPERLRQPVAERGAVLLESSGFVVTAASEAERDAARFLFDREPAGDGGAAAVENGRALQTSFVDSECSDPNGCGATPCNEILFLWDEPELNTGNLTVFVDDVALGTLPPLAAGDVPGTQGVFISRFSSGPHTIRIEEPGGTSAQSSIIVLDTLPFTEPQNLSCGEDRDLGPGCNLVATLENAGIRPTVYVVFLDGVVAGEIQGGATRILVTTEATAGEHCVTLAGILTTEDGSYRGCFNETCCELECADLPCDAPRSLLLCQFAYGEEADANLIRAAWINGETDYEAVTVSVDGVALPPFAGDVQGEILGPFAPGEHTVAVEGDCGADGVSATTERTITLLPGTPHPDPIDGPATCTYSAADGGTTVASWTNADPSNFIDVYVFDGSTLVFFGSRSGSTESVSVMGTTPEETIVLQFFVLIDGTCYGSELIECVPAVGGPRRYLPGACNGSDTLNLTSSVFLLNFLFLGGDPPPCRKACDCTGEGDINLSDAICNLNFLFLGGDAPFGWVDSAPTCVEVGPGDDCEAANPVCESLP